MGEHGRLSTLGHRAELSEVAGTYSRDGAGSGSGRAAACGYVKSGNHPDTVATTLGRLESFQTPPRAGSLGLLLSWVELGVGSHGHCQRPRLSPPLTIGPNFLKLSNALRQHSVA